MVFERIQKVVSRAQLRRSSGLTLVELLVAITVLAVLAIIGWSGLDSIVRSRFAIAADLEQVRGMQLSFAQLQSDCEQIAGASGLAGRSVLSLGNDRLTLVRTVIRDNAPSQLQVISYRVAGGKLQRQESRPTRELRELDMMWRAALAGAATSDDASVVLQHDMSGMAIRVWGAKASAWQSAGSSMVFSASDAQAPTGLEVTLRSAQRGGAVVKLILLGAI